MAQTIDHRQRLAEMMMRNQQPIQHWTQALGNVTNQVVGSMWQQQAADEDRRKKDETASLYADFANEMAGGKPAAGPWQATTTMADGSKPPEMPQVQPAEAKTIGGMTPSMLRRMMNNESTRGTALQIVQQERERQERENDPLRKMQVQQAQQKLDMGPLERQQLQAQIDQTRAATAKTMRGDDPSRDFKVREQEAQRLGLDPSSAIGRAYVLTGKMPKEDQQPLTATDKKAILEADDLVLANRDAIKSLNDAIKLNPKVNTGWTASARASLANNLPDMMVPDIVSSKQAGEDTANYENLVVGQALTQLKATFGAAPTEGERKILLELQGSVGKPVKVREEILKRALALAERRLADNQQRSAGLRSGTYFKAPTGAPAAPATSGGWSIERAD